MCIEKKQILIMKCYWQHSIIKPHIKVNFKFYNTLIKSEICLMFEFIICLLLNIIVLYTYHVFDTLDIQSISLYLKYCSSQKFCQQVWLLRYMQIFRLYANFLDFLETFRCICLVYSTIQQQIRAYVNVFISSMKF